MENILFKNNNFKSLKQNIEINLDVKELQTYFPIMEHYNNELNPKNVSLRSRYMITELIKNNTDHFTKKQSHYIKTFYTSKIYDRFNKTTIEKNIFIKQNPLIEVLGYSLDEFSLSKKILPDYISSITSDYINNYNNEAYIDAFFTFLGSKLTESGKCPTFPLFYGTYSCITKKFKYDITEDYLELKSNKLFKKNRNTTFNIEEVDIEIEESKEIDLEIIDTELETDILDLDDSYTSAQNKLEQLESMEKLPLSYKEYNGDINITNIDNNDIFSDISDDTFKYMSIKNFPTQLICMEKLDITLDDLLDEGSIDTTEWLSILFQICFGLAVAQKKFHFVHNDLHSSNIMFSPTDQTFINYEINNVFYKIPTYGRITKIIDFGRATFTHNKTLYFSSTFDENGDAEGQYDYPENNSLNNCKIKPNKSFDLARLATTIIEHFEKDTKLFNLLKTWMTDKYNKFLIDEEDDFDLYKKIAKDVKNAVPIKQLKKKIFNQFIINKKDIKQNDSVFRY